MRTFDVRVLVRGDHTVDEVMEQLLTGALRAHAVVELVPNELSPLPPVHRNSRSEAHYAAVRIWHGEALPLTLSPRPGVEPGSSAEVYP